MSNTRTYESAVAAQRSPGMQRRDGPLDLTELVRLGTLAVSSHNTQPWSFCLEDRAITIHPDFARRYPVVDPDDSHLFKSLGCAAENIALAAAAQGHTAHVRYEPANANIRIHFEPSQAVQPTLLFHAIPRRQCTRLPYDGQPIEPGALRTLERAGTGMGVRIMLIDDARMRSSIGDLVRRGNVVQFSDPDFRAELIAWLRFSDKSAIAVGDDLTARTTGQPRTPDRLGGFIIRRLLPSKIPARTDERYIRSSPLIGVLVAENDSPESWVEAGRVCQRFALQATALEIRSAFHNQLVEVRQLRSELHSLLDLHDEHALLLLRLGRGPEAPFSLRRPVEDVVVSPEHFAGRYGRRGHESGSCKRGPR